MAGISRLQMDAATITPEEKPVSPRCTRSPRPFFKKNTQAAPREVPKNGVSRPQNTIAPILVSLLSFVRRSNFNSH